MTKLEPKATGIQSSSPLDYEGSAKRRHYIRHGINKIHLNKIFIDLNIFSFQM